ncbi:MAG: hypothetical protein COV74_10195 [Candidatus Omnitrophica bacterium CG11_big_fil_rev_8_21_14_0_20_45_26]|uniref:ATP synthase F1 complex delta/epsilon subunit N-terminal domain-containing protein n=1 Tax=Candidatus Abzuiibacterium crystallinum TaxID=1974748 RepID=A0A2H0LMR3_9BACT|nr:MAG: hypothetical protein COV74_10195 [Candidatus Omnitrophica bacterium CG11_big_fil_rev_8_21_14_0_20_45_26]PIW63958.1 MAG: hypothetical protein COW12_08625 [Candidatus Omnitrophica bacterium CG12_big_fil_rev_8_21_14_0_65_45_16]
MAKAKVEKRPTFRLQVMSLRRILFDAEVEEAHMFGDEGEYDLLPYHYPLMGALPEGEIKVKGHGGVPLRAGVVMFQNNRCIVIIEEKES